MVTWENRKFYIDDTYLDYLVFGSGQKIMVIIAGLSTLTIGGMALPMAVMYRKFAKEYSPKAIVAIACERELSSGIKDRNLLHFPVGGVLNERPNGPGHITCVQRCKVRQAIAYFTET